MTDDTRLDDAQARRLWQRAAELQADAARALEKRSEGLARREVESESASTGYSLTHVRQAAVEAGISAEFVDRAIEESAALDHEDEATPLSRRMLGDAPPALLARRTYDHPAEVIFASMQRVFPRLRLSLIDTSGGEPLEGGWLHFDLPAVGLQATERLMVDLYHWADVRQIQSRLVALDDGRCELTLRAPLAFSRRLGTWVVSGLAPVAGLLAALLTGAIVSSVVAAPLAAWGAASGAFGLGTFGGVRGLRALTRAGWGKGEAALERLLGLIGMDARTGGAFQPAPPPEGGTNPLQGFISS
ncbi:MAG: hypothetical protein KJP18_02100 [Gemmatimonadetes bacterium]|nr:hypothetical protein [Gemmatimonadota bacterium]